MDRLIIVSGDGHIGARPEDYRDYLESPFRKHLAELDQEDRAMRVLSDSIHGALTGDDLTLVDPDNAMRSGGASGGWDMDRRLKELDREGVAAEILHHGHQLAIQPFFSVTNSPHPAELRAAGVRAYHRWAADCIKAGNGRFAGVADPGPCLDMTQTLRELEWAAKNGFRSVSVPGATADPALPPLHDSHFERFWSACDALGLVLSAHAGWGHAQGRLQEFSRQFAKLVVGKEQGGRQINMMEAMQPDRKELGEALVHDEESPLALDMGPRRLLWQLMLAGVFDRHPGLKLVLTEVRADWAPQTLRRLDRLFEQDSASLKMRPSEYWRRHCLITPSSIHRCELEMRHEIGVEQLMFGTDYPHPEGTWPNTGDWIRATFSGVPETEARLILGENAIRCYGLDREKIAAVAARIGPEPGEVLGTYSFREELMHQFDMRAGLRKPAEEVDVAAIDKLFHEDVAALTV